MPLRHQKIFLFTLLFLAAAVYFLNETGQVHFFYWKYWWYDIMMHFLGGFVVSGFGSWVYICPTSSNSMTLRRTLALSVGIGMSIGIGWELFEYFNGIYADQPGIVADTAGDLFMDCIGSIVSGLVVYCTFIRLRCIE